MQYVPSGVVGVFSSSDFPCYLPYPYFLLTLPLSDSAKLVYALILDRARRNAQNPKWQDPSSLVFVYYTVEQLSKAIGKSASVVKQALAALAECGLIERKRQGFNKPTKIYPCMPFSAVCYKAEVKKPSYGGVKNYLYGQTEYDPFED